jgi:microcystin-dependent protein
MTDAYIGEIRVFAGSFAPSGWARCDGALLPIAQNPPLFSILGTTYGGDGEVTFALPDLTGRSAAGVGASQDTNEYFLGEYGGERTVSLTANEVPVHIHQVSAAAEPGDRNSPSGAVWAEASMGRVEEHGYATAPDASTTLHPGALATAGGGVGHNNMPPYQVMTFIIALTGEFPSPGV